jgi:hypothetical protein
VQYGLFRYRHSNYFQKSKYINILPVGKIRAFHERTLKDAVERTFKKPTVNDPFTYRLDTNFTRPKKIFEVMEREIEEDGIFAKFLKPKAGMKITAVANAQ